MILVVDKIDWVTVENGDTDPYIKHLPKALVIDTSLNYGEFLEDNLRSLIRDRYGFEVFNLEFVILQDEEIFEIF